MMSSHLFQDFSRQLALGGSIWQTWKFNDQACSGISSYRAVHTWKRLLAKLSRIDPRALINILLMTVVCSWSKPSCRSSVWRSVALISYFEACSNTKLIQATIVIVSSSSSELKDGTIFSPPSLFKAHFVKDAKSSADYIQSLYSNECMLHEVKPHLWSKYWYRGLYPIGGLDITTKSEFLHLSRLCPTTHEWVHTTHHAIRVNILHWSTHTLVLCGTPNHRRVIL